MALTEIAPYERDSTDRLRDEDKRRRSPGSSFYSQGWSLVLAAKYFHGDRLIEAARSGVAVKHRHRIHLALFGQLKASFEHFLKDFVAKAIDSTSFLDLNIAKAKWIEIDAARVLATRGSTSTIGALLTHSTQRWHSPETVNERYEALFKRRPILTSEIEILNDLWILRHSVAHNAGFVTQYDASRLGVEEVSEKTVALDDGYIEETFEFLSAIVKRTTEGTGGALLRSWLDSLAGEQPSYRRDRKTYENLKLLATYVDRRPADLPKITRDMYLADFPQGQPRLDLGD